MRSQNARTPRPPSVQTKRNWWIDAGLFAATAVVLVSSFYFLYAPGGYQGGRNSAYNAGWIVARDTWDLLHTWFGIAMILIVAVHFVLHWKWFLMMGKRVWRQMTEGTVSMSRLAWVNLIVDAAIAAGFFLAAVSGVVFLFMPGGPGTSDTHFLFRPYVWDVIHTWSGIVMFLAFLGHTLIHWRWIVKVTARMFASRSAGRTAKQMRPQGTVVETR